MFCSLKELLPCIHFLNGTFIISIKASAAVFLEHSVKVIYDNNKISTDSLVLTGDQTGLGGWSSSRVKSSTRQGSQCLYALQDNWIDDTETLRLLWKLQVWQYLPIIVTVGCEFLAVWFLLVPGLLHDCLLEQMGSI